MPKLGGKRPLGSEYIEAEKLAKVDPAVDRQNLYPRLTIAAMLLRVPTE